jgi:hypothetical protein
MAQVKIEFVVMHADESNYVYSIASNVSGDFTSIFTFLTFGVGSADGTNVCASLMVNSDDLVEFEEYFTLVLSLETPGANINLENSITTVTITDSDGM